MSPYNHQVTFTPALERFARESTVFERAFTRYGATGLSVPSMWVGGLVLHKQYVTPFAPMNTLARLLEHEQYAQWISMDNILDVILPPSARRAPLDADVQVADFRLCRTLGEIRGRLDRLKAGGPPAFVYSLPQDVHIAAITREGAAPVDDASYGAFYAPYASRVRRLDACFGEFIDDLKSRGLFDQSLIVVTADHGDSLGEQGRMGHAYTIFPEILQVPLIVHLPSAWAGLRADTSAPAFTTDLTPTLYALLGHEPRPPAAFFGRPLFRKDGRSGAAAIDGSAGGRVELWERVRHPARTTRVACTSSTASPCASTRTSSMARARVARRRSRTRTACAVSAPFARPSRGLRGCIAIANDPRRSCHGKRGSRSSTKIAAILVS